jgi:predicted nucleotidyltransferase
MIQPLVEELEERSIPILRRHQVIEASVFGSFARGDVAADRDLDLE